MSALPTMWALGLGVALVIVTVQPVAVSRLLTGTIRLLGGLLRLPAWMLVQIETGSASVLRKTLGWGDSQTDGASPRAAAAADDGSNPASERHWVGMIVIARLLYLVMGIAILLGAVSLDIPRSCVVQFDCAGAPTLLPIPASVANGMLWFALAVFWGILLLDALDVVPKQLQLFAQLQPRVRRLLLWVAVVAEVLTTLTMALLYFIGQLAVYGERWPSGSLLVSTLQGPLVNTAAILALWALIYGAVALVSVMCLVVWLLSAVLRLPLHGADLLLGWVAEAFVPHLIEAVAGTLRGVWNAIARLPLAHLFGLRPLPSIQTAMAQGELGRDPLFPLPHRALDAIPGAPPSGGLPAHAASGGMGSANAHADAQERVADPLSPAEERSSSAPRHDTPAAADKPEQADGVSHNDLETLAPPPRSVVPLVPRPTQPVAPRVQLSADEMLLAPEEDLMVKDPVSYLITTLVGIDESGQRFMPRLVNATASLHGTSAIRALGLCNLRHLSEAPAALEVVAGETIDISITAAEVAAALERSHQPQQAEELLVNHLFDKIVRVNKGILEGQGLLLVAQDIRSLPRSVRAISTTHKRLHRFNIVVIGFLPTPDRYDQQFAAGARALTQLQHEGAIACTLLVDPHSPLAQSRGAAGQEELLAKALASLLVEHAHERDNLAPSEVFTQLGEHAPFIALSASSASVVAGEGPRVAGVLSQLLGVPRRGKGELNDIRSRAQDLTEQILTEDATRTINVAPNLERGPVFVTYTIPLQRQDVRWPQLRRSLTPWLAETFPTESIVPSFVQGNGVADGSLAGSRSLTGSSPYYVQASAFYGIPTVMLEGPNRPPHDDDDNHPDSGGGSLGEDRTGSKGSAGGVGTPGKPGAPRGRRHKRIQPLEDLWDFDTRA